MTRPATVCARRVFASDAAVEIRRRDGQNSSSPHPAASAAMISKDCPDPRDSEPRCHHDYQVSCGNCRLATICLPIALEASDIDKLDKIIQRGRPLRKGEHIYRENDPFTAVYAVRAGTIKGYSVTDDGQEQVTGFYFPGEILGMDGISKNKHASSARALETAAICEIPFERLGELSARIPSLQRHFFQLMSQEIAEDQQLITMLSKNSAEQRVAALLLSISARNVRRRLSATSFRLSMSRTDIGNDLGLTVETVSRVFGRFQKQGLLGVDNKEITVRNPELLRDAANGNAEAASGIAAPAP
jgi:CRP/FNR family transcriptional regulator, anaerobic regulatory protein